MGTNPVNKNPWFHSPVSSTIANLPSNFSHVSQHGAQTWLGSNPTPAIFFVCSQTFFYFNFLLQRKHLTSNNHPKNTLKIFIIFFRNFNLQITKAQPVNTNLAKSFTLNFHPKHFDFFFPELFFQFPFFFPNTQNSTLTFFFPSPHFENFFSSDT